jgi:hypothetical protein
MGSFDIREYQRVYLAKKRQNAIDYLGGRCVVCGTKSNLQFDHINSHEKTFSISRILSYKWDFLIKELRKCQILCAQHHLEKSKQTLDGNRTADRHGWKGYNHLGCRCEICRLANTEKSRKFRKKRKHSP